MSIEGPEVTRLPVLHVRNLVVSYDEIVALSGVDVDIYPGQVVALLGPNGAGKSSFVSAVSGLRSAAINSVIEIAGQTITSSRKFHRVAVSRSRGVASQAVALYPGLTGQENLTFYGELVLLSRAAIARRIEQLSDALGLDNLLNRRVAQLSGGEQRRLHVAVAMLHEPPLLILDEPTAGLDSEAREAVISCVREQAASGTAVLYTTHYLPEVEDLGADVVVLDQGKVITTGRVREIVEAHSDTFVEMSFLGEAPVLDHEVVASQDGSLLVRLPGGQSDLARLITGLGDHGQRIGSLRIVPPSLESALLDITGRAFPR